MWIDVKYCDLPSAFLSSSTTNRNSPIALRTIMANLPPFRMSPDNSEECPTGEDFKAKVARINAAREQAKAFAKMTNDKLFETIIRSLDTNTESATFASGGAVSIKNAIKQAVGSVQLRTHQEV